MTNKLAVPHHITITIKVPIYTVVKWSGGEPVSSEITNEGMVWCYPPSYLLFPCVVTILQVTLVMLPPPGAWYVRLPGSPRVDL